MWAWLKCAIDWSLLSSIHVCMRRCNCKEFTGLWIGLYFNCLRENRVKGIMKTFPKSQYQRHQIIGESEARFSSLDEAIIEEELSSGPVKS